MSYNVYFYYNKDNEIIYVGQALDVLKRWNTHNEPWKAEVKIIGVREYNDRAAMDIFEHYYITKYNPRYNKALLYHGTTNLELNDTSELKLYSLQDFKAKYTKTIFQVKPQLPQTHQPQVSYDEVLKAQGKIVIKCDSVDLFNDDTLKLNLNITWFKYSDKMYFSLIHSENQKLSQVPNNSNRQITLFKDILKISDNTNDNCFTFDIGTNIKRCESYLLDISYILKFNCYIISKNVNNSNETISKIINLSLIDEISVKPKSVNSFTGVISIKDYSKSVLSINSSEYRINLPELYNLINQ